MTISPAKAKPIPIKAPSLVRHTLGRKPADVNLLLCGSALCQYRFQCRDTGAVSAAFVAMRESSSTIAYSPMAFSRAISAAWPESYVSENRRH